MKLIVSQAAAADLERLHEFLADKNPAVARQAVAALVATAESRFIHFPRVADRWVFATFVN